MEGQVLEINLRASTVRATTNLISRRHPACAWWYPVALCVSRRVTRYLDVS